MKRIETYAEGVLIEAEEIPETWDDIRATREPLLARADIEVNKAADAGNGATETAWRAYRTALRDVPQAFATPDEVEWPTVPGE